MKKKKARKPDAAERIAADIIWWAATEQEHKALAARIRRAINAAIRAAKKGKR